MENNLKKFEINNNYPIYSSIMRFGIVGDKKYNLKIDDEYNIYLLSDNVINDSTVFCNNYYSTQIMLEDLDDIISEHLYVKYHNNIYKVLGVENGFSKFYLGTRGYNYLEEDKKLGFSYNDFLGAFMLEVSKKNVEVFSKSESIYQSIKRQKECYDAQKKRR